MTATTHVPAIPADRSPLQGLRETLDALELRLCLVDGPERPSLKLIEGGKR